MFDFNAIRQGALAALASVILTATAVGAAVAPAETGAAAQVHAAVQGNGSADA